MLENISLNPSGLHNTMMYDFYQLARSLNLDPQHVTSFGVESLGDGMNTVSLSFRISDELYAELAKPARRIVQREHPPGWVYTEFVDDNP
jgi:hypothetical protein